MSKKTTKPAAKAPPMPIPVQLSEDEFNQFIRPHLSLPRRGPQCKIGYAKAFNYILKVLYTGVQWRELPIDKDMDGQPEIHYTGIFKLFSRWAEDGSLEQALIHSVQYLNAAQRLDLSLLHGDGTNTVAKKGGQVIGYSGHKHQKGEKVIAIVDNHGFVLAPLVVAPVNETDMVLLPEGLSEFKRVAQATGLDCHASVLNLDAGFDRRANRKHVFNARLKPNIKENPRGRKKPKRGRPRFFYKVLYKKRFIVERTFAWKDQFRRVLLRFETKHMHHFGFKLLAFMLINLRPFCQS